MAVFAPFLLVAAASAQEHEQRLFDGRTLSGWDGDPKVWSVEDGRIVGRNDGTLPGNTFLCFQGEPVADFELSFRVRLEGDNNSGLQYRSQRLPGGGFRVAGPQCDVHASKGYLGMLYEEGGRGITALRGQRVHFDANGNKRVLKDDGAEAADLAQWHALRVVCKGNTVQHFVDGQLAMELADDSGKLAREGFLALQVHGGARMTVWFEDLVLRRLPKVEVALATPVAPATSAGPSWIWDASAEAEEEVFLRRAFALEQTPKSAIVLVTADNHFRLYVNGEKVGEGHAWENPRRFDVLRFLKPGANALALHAWNDGGPGGACAELQWSGEGAARGALATDATWRVSDDDPDGWNTAAFDDAKWQPATAIAALGEGPWSGTLAADAFGAGIDPDAPQPVETSRDVQVGADWKVERVLAVPRAFGSWVCLARDDKGRLYASDQQRGLYRVTPAGVDGRTDSRIERVEIDLEGCQGLCWAFGSLYAVVNHGRPGLHRLTDTNGDDLLDRDEWLRPLKGDGEHGPHAVEIAPDGRSLLVLCGNHVLPPEVVSSRVPKPFFEGVLLPGIDDPNGHAVGIRAPGGYVCRVDPDGKEWELYCCGFRNAYDLAVLPSGDVVTFDADMEWDMGLPWYRPTRILQVLSGVDYGWRTGSRKWGADLPDSLPSVCDIGPASPTGMAAFGAGALALDWTFGTAYEVALRADGAMLRGTAKPFAQGTPLPLADVLVDSSKGQVWLLTGGRGLPSRIYRLTHASGSLASEAPVANDARRARERLEAFHGKKDEAAIDAAFAFLGDADPALRSAARIALESQDPAAWRERALAGTGNVWSRLTALTALARCGGPVDLQPVLQQLARFDYANLDALQRVAWLRVHELAVLGLGPVPEATANELGQRLLGLFPSGDARLDTLLVGLCAHLEAKGLLERAVPMLEELRPSDAPPWAEISTRNANYGGAIARMLDDMPPASQIAIAYALRTVKRGWTLDQRRTFFAFLAAARQRTGGASYQGFCKRILEDSAATCTEDEQRELAELLERARAEPKPFVARAPKGPGRAWALDEATAVARRELAQPRDRDSGRNLFHAVGCAGCHRFAGEGSGVGPDLTSLGNKFGAADVLEAILEPSKVISDQFAGAVLTKTDGSTVFGRVAEREVDGQAVYEVVTATAEASIVRVPKAEVKGVAPAKLSPMPAGLVDRLNEQELADLLAYLLSRGR